ncbi:ABC transporter permease [Streptomyces sp. NBC_01239]|uniref:ABC transporter permease n=1 Tax=Streptomyces sp. NBC_01239 TaxID=2903792 RepID=UPI00224ECD8A|nr:ABC transporter permease [Streptomyces sp. NBC_01239]MCX4817975.1 ABC transporter permease [Streptomyces sp. NBC_01239]
MAVQSVASARQLTASGDGPGLSLWDRLRPSLFRTVVRLAILAALCGIWEFCSGRVFPVFVVSSPAKVWTQFGHWLSNGTLLPNLGVTLEEAVIGFLAGSIIGCLLGLVFGLYESVAKTIAPFANALYALPKVMLSPLIVVWFGIGMGMKDILAALTVMFVVFYNVWNATRRIDKNLLDQFHLMGASRWDTIVELYLPAAVGWLLTSLRIAFPLALIGAIVGEFIASGEGIGYAVLAAAQQYDAAGVLVGIISITITAVCIDTVLAIVQRYVARWQGEGEL